MELVNCKTCGVQIPATKAFCPECGNAMEAELARDANSQLGFDETAEFSKTQLGNMLRQIDLDISEPPPMQRQISPPPEPQTQPAQTGQVSRPPVKTSSAKILALVVLGAFVLFVVGFILAAISIVLFTR
jgi:hypothetical protein